MSRIRAALSLGLLKAYKWTLSPVFFALGVRCRHEPTCSEFASGCVTRHGWWPGVWMGIARVVRCRPGGSWGYDPVPETRPKAPLYAPWKLGDWRSGYRGGAACETTPRTGCASSRAE